MAGVNVSEASDDGGQDEDSGPEQSLVSFRAADLTDACVKTITALRGALPEATPASDLIGLAHAILFAAREDEEKLLVREHREEMANASASMCETMSGLMMSIRDDIKKRREEKAAATPAQEPEPAKAEASCEETDKLADEQADALDAALAKEE